MKQIQFILFFCLLAGMELQAQNLAFISDTQEPMAVETILLKTERNKEAADTLMADLLRRKHDAVFHLGDLVANGSSNGDWERIDHFLNAMQSIKTPVYAICGNHEYLMKASTGEKNFIQRFPHQPTTGYIVVQDSVAVVLFNSNFSKIGKEKAKAQVRWYERILDSLNRSAGVKCIIVCSHHSPYTNSNVVNPSKEVQELYVPAYINTPKAVLFLSGHSHNLEYFDIYKKAFLVIGGGGGLGQPLKKEGKKDFSDLLKQEQKPRYFYLEVKRQGNTLQVQTRGFKMEEFGQMHPYPVTTISF